ncbi:MAG: ATP-binding protein, partial [Rhizobacter sp.]
LDVVPSPVRAHEWALRELVRNLLHNAVKNTPDDSRLSVSMARDSRHVALTIADSGPGIAPDQRERLFQPFAAGAPAGDLQRGSGLGLAIVHEIVVSLGGSIELENRAVRAYVQGLDATVRLPLADNPPR